MLNVRYVAVGDSRQVAQKTTERDGKFTDIAKTIGAAMGGNALRNYRRQQAQQDFANLSEKIELSADDLGTHLVSAKQESLPLIDKIDIRKIQKQGLPETTVFECIASIIHKASTVLSKTVETVAIERLRTNPDISSWVEEGIGLHALHSSDHCEYCGQQIPELRMKQLAAHFNEVDKQLKSQIDSLVNDLKLVYVAIHDVNVPDRARFYSVLQEEFDTSYEALVTNKDDLLAQIVKLGEELKEKKAKTTEVVAIVISPSVDALAGSIDNINGIIDRHNKTTSDFEFVKQVSVGKIKNHYLTTIYNEVKSLDSEIETSRRIVDELTDEINEIQQRIGDAMALISSDHRVCDQLNEKLTAFLGHQELEFQPHTEKELDASGTEIEVVKGYDIMRGNTLATYLSEGEKTAIAFVYFVVHLGDRDFDLNEGIVVVDDPISSLDSNPLYQAFSFLKNSVKDAAQVFIFTHNFDFLKLLLNWRKNTSRGSGQTGYFMIKNSFSDEARRASIEPMDKELCEYESEYHYLFKLLKQMRNEHDGSIAKAYPVPNIARKVWDTFTMHSVPNGKSPYKKVEELKAAGHDEQRLDSIYKFINDQSHVTGSGFDPALVTGVNRSVEELLEMMKSISPEHFRIIDEATN